MQPPLERFVDPATAPALFTALDELVKTKALRGAAKHPNFARGLDHLQRWAAEGDDEVRLTAIAALLKVGNIVATKKTKAFPPPVPDDIARRIQLATVNPVQSDVITLTSDDRVYLYTALAFSKADWCSDYLADGAVLEESGENARSAAIKSLVHRSASLDEPFELLSTAFARWRPATEEPQRTKLLRLRRLLTAISAAIREASSLPTPNTGLRLRDLVRAGTPNDGRHLADKKAVRDLASGVYEVIHAIIARDFSVALDASTYAAAQHVRRTLPDYAWERVAPAVPDAAGIKSDITTALTILAKQGAVDEALFKCLIAVAGSEKSARTECIKIAERHPEINPEVQAWLRDVAAPKFVTEGPSAQYARQQSDDEYIANIILDTTFVYDSEHVVREQLIGELEILFPTLVPPVKAYLASANRLLVDIRQFASRRKLRTFSERHSIEEYSPARHALTTKSAPTRNVRIVAPGVERMRDDGMSAVIIKSNVEITDEVKSIQETATNTRERRR